MSASRVILDRLPPF